MSTDDLVDRPAARWTIKAFVEDRLARGEAREAIWLDAQLEFSPKLVSWKYVRGLSPGKDTTP